MSPSAPLAQLVEQLLLISGSRVRVPGGAPFPLAHVDRENRGIAQLVEQWSPKPRAEGSSPSAPAIVSVFSGEGPPVPIPNTEVKLTCADDTWLETTR